MLARYLATLIISGFAVGSVGGNFIENINDDLLDRMNNSNFNKYSEGFYRSLPRYDLHLKSATNEWDPSNIEYVQGLAVLAVPFLFSAFTSLIAGLIAPCIKLCRLPSALIQTKMFPSRSIVYSRVKLLIVSILLCATIAFCIVGNVSLHMTFFRSMDTISDTETKEFSLLDNVNSILSEMQSLNNSEANEIQQELSVYISYSNNTSNQTQYFKEMGEHFEDIREKILFSLCGAAFILCIFAISVAIAKARRPSFCAATLTLLFIPVFWVLIAVNLPAAVFIADACPVIEQYIENQTSEQDAQYISYYLECEEGTTGPLKNLTDLIAVKQLNLELYLFQLGTQNVTDPKIIDPLNDLLNDLVDLRLNVSALNNCTATHQAWVNLKGYICNDALASITLTLIGCLLATIFVPCVAAFAYELHLRLSVNHRNNYDSFDESESVMLLNESKESYKSSSRFPKPSAPIRSYETISTPPPPFNPSSPPPYYG